jgi:hypothetical protein
MPAVEIYRDHVLPFYPPVFHKWFLKSFSDPTTWFEARLAYARAIAVMSMVGYLVGYVLRGHDRLQVMHAERGNNLEQIGRSSRREHPVRLNHWRVRACRFQLSLLARSHVRETREGKCGSIIVREFVVPLMIDLISGVDDDATCNRCRSV